MKAVCFDNFGDESVLQIRDLPKPEPGKGEVLIRVHAAGVNPVDWKIREGLLKTRMPHQFPIIPGWDVAGTIEKLGPGCRRFKKGAAVYAYARKPVIKDGCYAEYVVLPEKNVALKPRSMDFKQAASIPLAALTAWQSLFDAAELQKGDTILIHAAAGGVGGFAVQLAKWKGARVIATASANNHEYVRSLGADEVIDYTQTDFVEAVRTLAPKGVDVAYDTVGESVQVRSIQTVRKGGTLVTILAPTPEAQSARGLRLKYVFVAPNARQLARLASLIEAGKFKTHLTAELPLEQAAEAQRMSRTGHTRGKIVLVI
ncbi:MAG: NADP-dependent oxidoreductase [Kiritimatiellae bacterium]|nr:NADP-dependent oxidoreductase [Kiritimatiellia bacterium]MDW8459003.1 NADP-dependent oxidoreductase [Verrucomicrobiota bacterium]